MSNISIPSALGPHGNMVPIEEAIRHKLDYYTCPECNEFLDPRKGTERQYFAHKKGVLDDTSCSLSSQADVDRMVDDLRTSDIEEEEKQRTIRVNIGKEYESYLECFGVIPSLEWNKIPPHTTAEALLAQLEIHTVGIENPPVAQNFHPSRSETTFNLDPTADEFRVSITGPQELESIVGEWTADGLADGDLFVGDQSRARRHRSNRQIKQGEWVYLVTSITPPHLPKLVESYTLGGYDVLSFPARETTKELLEKYGEGLTTDDYGFDADVLLPADAHPTIEAPIASQPNESLLVGVTPAQGIDPAFEVVSIPKTDADIVDLESTGPGNPRYWVTSVPEEGSRRISIHQRNSNRHRMIHLHTDPEKSENTSRNEPWSIGLLFHLEESEPVFLDPIGCTRSICVDSNFKPQTLPTILEYVGPEGLDIEIRATFLKGSKLGPTLTRTTRALESNSPEFSHWVREGCEKIEFNFDGIGRVDIKFPQPALATFSTEKRSAN